MADKKKKSSKKSSKKGTKKAKKESKASKVEEEQEVTLDSFIEEKPTHKNGQIYLIVSEARALAKKNLFSKNNKSDPYTVITFEEEGEEKKKKKEDDPRVYKSKVLKKNLDPQWNEGSKIFPITKKDRKIVISLWNANKLRSDDFMGQITFDIIKINDGLPYQDWYQLQSREGKKDKIKGEIHLQLMYIGEDDKVTGDEFKWPLHSFLAKRRLDIVAKLIKRKEAIDKKDANQLTPLHIAAKANLFDGVRLLLSAGADHSITGGEDALLPIHSACTASPESVKYLLEADTTTVAAKDANENTPLHTAASNDQPTTVLLLLSKKAKINEQNKAGDTPLHCAIKARAFQAMKALVDSKADIYVRNNDKLTCGELAASIDEETKELFMAAVDVEDYAEIGYLETWKQKTKIESKGMSHNWAKSPQFIITAKTSKKKKKKKDDAPKQIKCKILVHHKGQPDNTQLGFFVLRAENTVYNQPCYTELCAYDDGKVETIIGEDEKLPHLVVVPYAKLKETAGEISVMVFTMEGQEVEIKQLKKMATLYQNIWCLERFASRRMSKRKDLAQESVLFSKNAGGRGGRSDCVGTKADSDGCGFNGTVPDPPV
eukprot:TRINITY_DN1279_c0_g1_i3.p1 TRINITY_DN1279_c0_g1~~TRINITY_DN1279_c0_g1_i3.p1  ORF type:complete len:602 (-),score=147.04 TRINITY_DN1279_c0_g1_i3:31-1836(-)